MSCFLHRLCYWVRVLAGSPAHPKDRIFETTFTLFLLLSGSPLSVQKPI
jgi:hypothetical protein